jgi:hypothetical protein
MQAACPSRFMVDISNFFVDFGVYPCLLHPSVIDLFITWYRILMHEKNAYPAIVYVKPPKTGEAASVLTIEWSSVSRSIASMLFRV